MSEACEATSVMFGIDCGQPSIGRYAGACVHEHVTERELCAVHAKPRVALWCRVCYGIDGPAGHECPVVLTRIAEAHAASAPRGTEADGG